MENSFNVNENRRLYSRVQAPVQFRPARVFSPPRPVFDIGLGGVRVASDQHLHVGEQQEIELILPDQFQFIFTARVAWLSRHIENGETFDVGLEFVQIPSGALAHLAQVLKKYE